MSGFSFFFFLFLSGSLLGRGRAIYRSGIGLVFDVGFLFHFVMTRRQVGDMDIPPGVFPFSLFGFWIGYGWDSEWSV